MRTALLIGLMVVGVAGAAQAQGGYKPYQPKDYGAGPSATRDRDPYDLPKAQQTNPYDRDYSKPDPGTRGPGYRNVDGSLPSQRNSNSSSGGFYSGYGARPSAPPSYGSGARRNPNCSKPGVVC
jgi:hypothetical protein